MTVALPLLPAKAAAPSFDCRKPQGQVQELVCGDAQLSALDRETTRLLALAEDGERKTGGGKTSEGKTGVAKTGVARTGGARALATSQQAWLKARDACSSDTEMRACVLGGYMKRITELRQGYKAARSADRKGISLGPDNVTCEGMPAAITTTFANTQTPIVYLSWGGTSLVAQLGPTGSGARYIAPSEDGDTVFWIKGRAATLTMPDGKEHACTIAQPT